MSSAACWITFGPVLAITAIAAVVSAFDHVAAIRDCGISDRRA